MGRGAGVAAAAPWPWVTDKPPEPGLLSCWALELQDRPHGRSGRPAVSATLSCPVRGLARPGNGTDLAW